MGIQAKANEKDRVYCILSLMIGFTQLAFSNFAQRCSWEFLAERNCLGAFKLCHMLAAKADDVFRTGI